MKRFAASTLLSDGLLVFGNIISKSSDLKAYDASNGEGHAQSDENGKHN